MAFFVKPVGLAIDVSALSCVPIYSLNVSEAAEYYGIGEKRLRQIAGENEGADFILEVGSHIRFKRKLFEDYLDTASTV